jgi:hypothetical protein
MNKKNVIIGIIIVAIIGIIYFVTKKEVVAPVIMDNKPIELCFALITQPNERGFHDEYTLRMLLSGEGGTKVTGQLNYLPGEKDSKVGKIEGTAGPVDKIAMARTADLWWDTFGEGISAREQLRIIFGEGVASMGAGELVDRGDGVYVYKDLASLQYAFSLNDVSCLDLTERENVENYLKNNITALSPVKAVLGGTWYVLTSNIDLAKNTGTVTYEDGHVQEKRNFSYTANEKGEILNLTIN